MKNTLLFVFFFETKRRNKLANYLIQFEKPEYDADFMSAMF